MRELVAMFVYGTLRPDQGLVWNELIDSDDVVEGCRTKGKLWYAFANGGYPVAKLDVEEEIVGDILWLEPHGRLYQHICDVETGAGYEMWEVPVITPDGETQWCECWHYARAIRSDQQPVPGNDWLAQERARRVYPR